MLQYAVFVGAAVHLFGTWLYLRDTLWGDTKPNRVTFLLWAAAPFIETAAALAEGVTLAVIPVFLAGFGPFLILIASFVNKNAYWKLGLFDYICGLFSVLALVLWWITNQPSVAIAFAIVSDGFALLPTLKKSWTHPHTETGIAYATSLFSALTSFFAIKALSFPEIAFPVYLVIANSSLLFAIYRGRITDTTHGYKIN